MDRSLRIGIIAPAWVPVPPRGYGGTEAVLDSLARGLTRAGHEVVLFATGDSTCPVDRRSYWPQGVTPMGAILPEVAHVIAAYDALGDCDVVHDHTLVGPLLTERHRMPVVTTNHAPFTPEIRALYAAATPAVSLVAISHSQRAGAPEIPVARVIHHGVDPESIPVGDGRGGYLLFLGRMSADKGVHRAIDVARRAGVPLKIAAKMREEAEIAYFDGVVRPLLGGDVEYLGEVSPGERDALLGSALALVNPIAWPEPFGMVMVESLATGTPVLAAPLGAAPEIVDDGVTGFLRTDVEGLAAAVPLVAGLDRARCRAVVETRFSADRMVAEHADLYTSLARRLRRTYEPFSDRAVSAVLAGAR
ncbi:MAG TPA: glycosyltransferase family 4 protein [Frankiaceae bacterium]|nr:glycosyltransferase family 4 protein [Frankiaceae bacterium]